MRLKSSYSQSFEQVGSGLIQDTVIRVSGKVTARDREGNVTADVKMIADDIQIVTDIEPETTSRMGGRWKSQNRGKG